MIARFKAQKTDDLGMAADFSLLKKALAEAISELDHRLLNEVAPFDHINPSAENIAAAIYQALEESIAPLPVKLDSVEVWESPRSGARYTPD